MNTQIKEPNQNLISFPPTLYIQGDKEYRQVEAEAARLRMAKQWLVMKEIKTTGI